MHLRVPAHINIFSGALVALPSSTLVVIHTVITVTQGYVVTVMF